MTRRSLDSEKPILAPSLTSKRASVRYSTYSATSPSFTSDRSSSSGSTEKAANMQEIRTLTQGLDRLDNKPLSQQRFQLNDEQVENMKKIALGAKLDKALSRRMTNQDYSPRVTRISEKDEEIKA